MPQFLPEQCTFAQVEDASSMIALSNNNHHVTYYF